MTGTPPDHGRWWDRAPDPTGADPVVVAFPFAGGGARFYAPWRERLAGAGELVAVQLPGRESRIRERPHSVIGPLVDEIIDAWPLRHQPYLLFGHSLGATLAYAVAREVRRRGLRQPVELILSAAPAPHLRDRADLGHRLDDAGLADRLRRYNGTSPEVFESPALLTLMLPTIRADFTLFETWDPPPEAPLAVPITVLGGDADRTVTAGQLEGWRSLTTAGCEVEVLPGDHFSMLSSSGTVVELVRQHLRRITGRVTAR